MSRDHKPITLTQFTGHYDRGDKDSVPFDHASDTLNLMYTADGFNTRFGTTQSISFPGILRFHVYKRTGETSRLLILNSSGQIFDSLDLLTPILTIPGMTDFAFQTFFNRAYISPSNGNTGLAGQYVWVYDGTTCRLAGGAAPSGTLVATDSATTGHVEAGVHLFAVAFETESGFITKPGPALYAVLNAVGSKAVDLSSIPTGPTGTVARIILATKRVPTYNGDQNISEFFMVPNGRLGDNVSLTFTVDFFDADLLQSADYLFDQLDFIPAGVGLGSYQGRLVSWGSQTDPSVVRFSKPGDPESNDAISGFLVVDPTEDTGIKSGVEFRNNFYMMKSLRTYSVADDTVNDPAFWKWVTIDYGIGTEQFGIGTILNSKGTNIDRFVIASRKGLVLFDGVYGEPELSWKISSIWRRINFEAFNKVQVAVHSTDKQIFVSVPLDGSETNNYLIYGDFQKGLNYSAIQWSLWKFTGYNPTAISIDIEESTRDSFLRIAGETGVYDIDRLALSDNGSGIDTIWESALLRPDDTGFISHFGAVRIRVRGNCILQITLRGEDNSSPATLIPLTVNTAPGKELLRLANFEGEKCSVRLRSNLFNEHFQVSKMNLFAAAVWAERPQDG